MSGCFTGRLLDRRFTPLGPVLTRYTWQISRRREANGSRERSTRLSGRTARKFSSVTDVIHGDEGSGSERARERTLDSGVKKWPSRLAYTRTYARGSTRGRESERFHDGMIRCWLTSCLLLPLALTIRRGPPMRIYMSCTVTDRCSGGDGGREQETSNDKFHILLPGREFTGCLARYDGTGL